MCFPLPSLTKHRRRKASEVLFVRRWRSVLSPLWIEPLSTRLQEHKWLELATAVKCSRLSSSGTCFDCEVVVFRALQQAGYTKSVKPLAPGGRGNLMSVLRFMEMFGTWVVAKIIVPFWVLSAIRHLVIRGPKRGTTILSTTHMVSFLRDVCQFEQARLPFWAQLQQSRYWQWGP